MEARDKDIYAAGMIDGEGTITLSHIHRNTWRAPVVSISSTSHGLIAFFKSSYGGSVITKRTYAKHHAPSWEWRLTYNAALSFLARVLPFLQHEEKIRRANLLLDRYKAVTPRNGRYSDQQKHAKREFERSFFHPSAP
jgi:hypothetical protein